MPHPKVVRCNHCRVRFPVLSPTWSRHRLFAPSLRSRPRPRSASRASLQARRKLPGTPNPFRARLRDISTIPRSTLRPTHYHLHLLALLVCALQHTPTAPTAPRDPCDSDISAPAWLALTMLFTTAPSRWRTALLGGLLASLAWLPGGAAQQKTQADYFVHSLPGAPEPLLKMHAG